MLRLRPLPPVLTLAGALLLGACGGSDHAGDAVEWANVSGGPHNVTSWADSIPGGAQAQLAPNMPNTTAPLAGPLLTDPNATYAVSFAGLTPGVYHYYRTPHLALGMKATVTVQ